MRTIELSAVEPEQRNALQGEEPHPWGAELEALTWAQKSRFVGVPGADGELLALAGALVAEVRVEGHPPFSVAGIGGVIVRPDARGRGLAKLVIARILDVCRDLGPARAMLFCREPLVALYEGFGFRLIEAPVGAEQPGGRIVMPMRAMWAPLRDGAGWPPGTVEVLGEPF